MDCSKKYANKRRFASFSFHTGKSRAEGAWTEKVNNMDREIVEEKDIKSEGEG
ncbi:MAG TPA: hypothetical protein GXX65_06890 [Methanosarcina sp.]|nr:hypothetical protein [Methanosarcina sp.]HHV24264.1 hypothetical protein [Methanosarcina sp.]